MESWPIIIVIDIVIVTIWSPIINQNLTIIVMTKLIWLVVSAHLEKYEFVNGKDSLMYIILYIQYIYILWKITKMFQTTKQWCFSNVQLVTFLPPEVHHGPGGAGSESLWLAGHLRWPRKKSCSCRCSKTAGENQV